ncbi:uncharacterized protein ACWYII_008871 [Salvelinus alpinus]
MSLYVSLYYMSSSYFPGVSGVTVVTQKPPVVTVRKGEKATMLQLQYMLRWYHTGWSSVEYGSGFSSHKFTSNHQSKSDYCLIINNVEETDSAVYYCQTQNDSPITVINTMTKPPHQIHSLLLHAWQRGEL